LQAEVSMSSWDPRQSNPIVLARLYLTLVAAAALLFGVLLGAREGRWNPLGGLLASAQTDTLQVARSDLREGDYTGALQLFTSEATKGNSQAKYWLGYMNELGLGTPRDIQQAIRLYQQAADKNVVAAELRLGDLYLHGNYVPPDPGSAKSYLERAAYQGEPRAAMLLGQMYANGLGIAPDPTKAYAWSEVATIEGNRLAIQERNASRRQLDVKDQSTAVDQSKDILAKINEEKMPHSSGSKDARAQPSNSATPSSTSSATLQPLA
jgi:TPR repeat protein